MPVPPDLYIDAASPPSRPGRPPLKIVFFSPFNLLDSASGAAQSVRTMLEQLAARGADCSAVTACCFDLPPGERLADILRPQGLAPTGAIKELGLPVWQGRVRGVRHNAVQFATQSRMQFTAVEEVAYRDIVRGWLEQHRPDVVLTFGGLLLDIEIQRCTRAAGALLVFYLANPNYGRPETFSLVDLVLTNSMATSEHYRNTLGLPSRVAGLFVDTARALASKRDPQCISFINPLPEKGVTLFLRLVARAAREAPDMRFLVVESRARLGDALAQSGLPATLLDLITVLPRQDEMATVYAVTKVLLMPSFWFEAAGRVLPEANANGIPVIASNRGGIPETLDGAGCLLPVPQRCIVNHAAVPDDEEVTPWWNELLRLWRDAAYYNQMSQRALAVAARQDLALKTAALELVIHDALLKRATSR